MTTLIQNEQKRQKIMARMREHLVPVLEHCRGGWVGLFLQGSQNYNLDYEGSDIDTKAIMLPSFSDFVLNAKPLSTTHIMENNEHVDFKDIRLMFDCIKKQNVNFVEILFTPYSIINPEYADLFQTADVLLIPATALKTMWDILPSLAIAPAILARSLI